MINLEVMMEDTNFLEWGIDLYFGLLHIQMFAFVLYPGIRLMQYICFLSSWAEFIFVLGFNLWIILVY